MPPLSKNSSSPSSWQMSDSIPTQLKDVYERMHEIAMINGFQFFLESIGTNDKGGEILCVEISYPDFKFYRFYNISEYSVKWIESKFALDMNNSMKEISAIKFLMDKYDIDYYKLIHTGGSWIFYGTRISTLNKPLSTSIEELEEAILAHIVATSSS